MVLVVLEVPGEDLDWIINHKHKVLSWMMHGRLVVSSSVVKFLTDIPQLEDPYLGSIGHGRSDVCNGLNDIIDNSFERFNGVN